MAENRNNDVTLEIKEFIGALDDANDKGWHREQERSRDRVLKETLSRDDHNLLSNTNGGMQYVNICTVMPRYMIKLTVISAEGDY